MRIIATPIILENYKDWVIMSKQKFLECCRDNHWTVSKDNPFDAKEIIEKFIESWKILGDFDNLVIIDRKYYDISKLKDY